MCVFELGVLGLSGGVLCEQPAAAAPVVVDTSCKAFERITYSRNDQPLTRQQVREHNAAYDALCGKSSTGNK